MIGHGRDIRVLADQHQSAIGWDKRQVDIARMSPFLFPGPVDAGVSSGDGRLFERVLAGEVRMIPVHDRSGTTGDEPTLRNGQPVGFEVPAAAVWTEDTT